MFRAKDDSCLVTVLQYQNNFPFDLYISMSFSYLFLQRQQTHLGLSSQVLFYLYCLVPKKTTLIFKQNLIIYAKYQVIWITH